MRFRSHPNPRRSSIGSIRIATALAAAAVTALLAPAGASAAPALQPLGNFSSPTYITSDPVVPGRLFVVEQRGTIQVIDEGVTSQFVDLTGPVLYAAGGERGLLSVAFGPDFGTTGKLYVYYTGEDGPGNIHIGELTARGGVADPASLRNVITIPHSSAANHNGGQLQFGPDGLLYAGTGDGGGGGDPSDNGQNLNSLLGKLLRISPAASGTQSYTVPATNPFVGVAGADEIWSSGLRNPFRFSFDSVGGDLLIGDVGQSLYEEIDRATQASGGGRGLDFGWDCREGLHAFTGTGPSGPAASCATTPLTNFTDPIFEYDHANGGANDRCSVTGGYVVRDAALGPLVGKYLYADFCQGQLRALDLSTNTVAPVGLTIPLISSFGEDSCGRLYGVSLSGGAVSAIRDSVTASTCATFPLGAATSGTGTGTVLAPGISCPGDCSAAVKSGQPVRLEAVPALGSTFAGWSGDCTGTASCLVNLDAARNVTATFAGPTGPPEQTGPTGPTGPVTGATALSLVPKRTRVPKGGRVNLFVSGTPCPASSGYEVELRRAGFNRGSKKLLNSACSARFKVRVGRQTAFTAVVSVGTTLIKSQRVQIGIIRKP